MNLISTLIIFPLVASLLTYVSPNNKIRDVIVRLSAIVTAVLSIFVIFRYFNHGLSYRYPNEEAIDLVIAAVEILVAAIIIYLGIINKKYIVSVFSIIQTPLILWFEFTQKKGIEVENSIIFDKLSAIMVLVIGIVGSLICIYAVGYMKDYHKHHTEYKDRKNFFFAVLFLFLSAMFGLVLSNDLTWIYFC